MPTPTSPVPPAAAGAAAPRLAQRPAARYGDRTSPRRRWTVRAGIAGLVIIAVASWAWLAYLHADAPVRGELSSYGDITDTSIDIHWTVQRSQGIAVVCTIRARDLSGAEVGRARVEVPAGPASSLQLDHRLVTLVRPYTGELVGCRELR